MASSDERPRRSSDYIYADLVRRAVDEAPPLSAEQRAKLAILLRPGIKTEATAVREEGRMSRPLTGEQIKEGAALREAVARAIHRRQPTLPSWEACLERADLILCDLYASGYEIVKRSEATAVPEEE